MAELVLATLNARYAHASLALRYLKANLRDELAARAAIRELTIKDPPERSCEALLAGDPKVIGLGIYIWNVTQTLPVVRLLKERRPDVQIVLGGPEVSHETAGQPIVEAADYVICGEGEVSFDALCARLLAGERPAEKVLPAVLPDVEKLRSPYRLYTDEDVRQRVVYVEASRGCPFKCEFCLSSLDKAVRAFPLRAFLAEMDALLLRGVRQFKFIDRTFNLKIQTSAAILQFFLDRYIEGLFLHFEMIPDRLPEELRTLIAKFPKGAVQLEVGVQTFNDEVSRRISRRQDNARVEDNLRFLRDHTGVHVHADLIAGLPGEDLASFGAGFDRLFALGAAEIQVGILKRLRGTPIVRHDVEWAMEYAKAAPYEVLQTRVLDRQTLGRVRDFAKVFDLVHNSGNFKDSSKVLLATRPSPFEAFLAFSDGLVQRRGRTHSLPLEALAEELFRHLVASGVEPQAASDVVLGDYLRPGSRHVPLFFRSFRPHQPPRRLPKSSTLPKRQARHLS